MERWNGRVALVTGASVGIGAGICRELVKYGMIVVGCARNVQQIRDIAEEPAVKISPGRLDAIKCDLSDESEIMAMFEEIRKKYDRIDVCINNAGFSTECPLLSGKTEEWRNMLNVNVLALCICTREAVKIMREKSIDDGQIIHISSMAAHRIPPHGVSFYSGTKAMVRCLTEGLRRELRALHSHIRVASISPGIVHTEFFYRLANDEEKVRSLYQNVESLEPKDIADAVVYILKTPPHVDVHDVLMRPVEQAS